MYLVGPWRWECLANLQAMTNCFWRTCPGPLGVHHQPAASEQGNAQPRSQEDEGTGGAVLLYASAPIARWIELDSAMAVLSQRERGREWLFIWLYSPNVICRLRPPVMPHHTMDPCLFVSHFWHLCPREGKCDADVCHEMLKHHLRLDGELVSPQHTLVASVGRWRSPHDVNHQPPTLDYTIEVTKRFSQRLPIIHICHTHVQPTSLCTLYYVYFIFLINLNVFECIIYTHFQPLIVSIYSLLNHIKPNEHDIKPY